MSLIKLNLVGALFWFLISQLSFATIYKQENRVQENAGGGQFSASTASASFCEIKGSFLRETYQLEEYQVKGSPRTERLVGWEFEIDKVRSVRKAACPSGGKFVLSVRRAGFFTNSDGQVQFVYFQDQRHPPKVGGKVVLQAIKQSVQYGPGTPIHDEWRVEDWTNGMVEVGASE